MNINICVLLLTFCFGGTASGQIGPLVYPRSVVNTFTQEPAPSPVAPGGLISIGGSGLASAQVTIGGEAAAVVSN